MKRHRRCRGILVTVLIIFVCLAVLSAIITDKNMAPIINTLAMSRAKNLTTLIINDTVAKMLSDTDNSFSELIKIEYDENGKISALTTDSIKMNTLKSLISVYITEAVGKIEESRINVAVGTLTGNSLLAGRGPEIELNVHISCSCSIEVKNSFEYSGINQTMHKVLLEIAANVYVLSAGENLSSRVYTSIPVAETVIIGQIPEIYAGKDDSLWQDLIN